jgi:hypothetical protein
MIARSGVTFRRIRGLLAGLGFIESRRGKFWYFEHAATGALLAYRAYRPQERILAKDLLVTRQDLDWHDLMGAEAFDDVVAKESAVQVRLLRRSRIDHGDR